METLMQCESTMGAHAKFSWLETPYKNNLELADDVDNDDLQADYYRECALRCYFLVFVGTSMLVGKKCNLRECGIH